ncbi:unnamed protein product [Phytomonas sp. Hart1]|nr:unnamed protein product [Phytomonas sp. Hart1]|eukprot:CCW70950.1 unnamed protein product [Phytomonas sp. isolate Hart1]
MSSTTATVSRSGKTYLRPDTSKSYDYVPFTPFRKSSFFERQVSRFSTEIGFNLLRPYEKVFCIFILVAMMILPYALFILLKQIFLIAFWRVLF